MYSILGYCSTPCHIGHIKIAEYILNTLTDIDEVWLMPTYHHMFNKDTISAEHRLAMCEIARRHNSHIRVFDYEIANRLHGETYYTIETLLSDMRYSDYSFKFIIGIDNANTFERWFMHNELQQLIKFIVLPRVGFEPLENAWYQKQDHIYLPNHPDTFSVSSTNVRKLLKNYYINNCNDEEIVNLIGFDVFDYILKNNLYRE